MQVEIVLIELGAHDFPVLSSLGIAIEDDSSVPPHLVLDGLARAVQYHQVHASIQGLFQIHHELQGIEVLLPVLIQQDGDIHVAVGPGFSCCLRAEDVRGDDSLMGEASFLEKRVHLRGLALGCQCPLGDRHGGILEDFFYVSH